MISAFEYSRGGFLAHLDQDHSLLLKQLISEILLLLDDSSSPILRVVSAESQREAPNDPALDHLLPPMSVQEEEAARMRALTEDSVRAEKSERLRLIAEELGRAYESGEQVWFAQEDAWRWLAGLNDLRLALAGELSLHSQGDAERVERLALGQEVASEQQKRGAAVYLLLTWWQDSLLSAMRSTSSTN